MIDEPGGVGRGRRKEASYARGGENCLFLSAEATPHVTLCAHPATPRAYPTVNTSVWGSYDVGICASGLIDVGEELSGPLITVPSLLNRE